MCGIVANWGSAWGTWKAGLGVCHMGIDYSKGVIKNIVPIVMAGVLGIYGLIVSVIIVQAILPPDQNSATTYSAFNGYSHVSAMMNEERGMVLLLANLTSSALYSSWLLDCAVDYRVWQLEGPLESLVMLVFVGMACEQALGESLGKARSPEVTTMKPWVDGTRQQKMRQTNYTSDC